MTASEKMTAAPVEEHTSDSEYRYKPKMAPPAQMPFKLPVRERHHSSDYIIEDAIGDFVCECITDNDLRAIVTALNSHASLRSENAALRGDAVLVPRGIAERAMHACYYDHEVSKDASAMVAARGMLAALSHSTPAALRAQHENAVK